MRICGHTSLVVTQQSWEPQPPGRSSGGSENSDHNSRRGTAMHAGSHDSFCRKRRQMKSSRRGIKRNGRQREKAEERGNRARDKEK